MLYLNFLYWRLHSEKTFSTAITILTTKQAGGGTFEIEVYFLNKIVIKILNLGISATWVVAQFHFEKLLRSFLSLVRANSDGKFFFIIWKEPTLVFTILHLSIHCVGTEDRIIFELEGANETPINEHSLAQFLLFFFILKFSYL